MDLRAIRRILAPHRTLNKNSSDKANFSNYLRIESEGGMTRFLTRDSRTVLYSSFGTGWRDFDVVVNLEELAKVLPKVGDLMAWSREGRLYMSTSNGDSKPIRLSLSASLPTDFVWGDHFDDTRADWETHTGDVLQMIDLVRVAAQIGSPRSNLCGVYLDAERNRLVATDGLIFAKLSSDTPVRNFDSDRRALIDVWTIRVLEEVEKRRGEEDPWFVIIDKGGPKCSCFRTITRDAMVSVMGNIGDLDDYPEFDELLQHEAGETILCFDPAAMLPVVNQSLKMGDRGLDIKAGVDSINCKLVTVNDYNSSMEADVPCSRMDNVEGFEGRLFQKRTKTLMWLASRYGTGEVLCNFGHRGDPVLITSGNFTGIMLQKGDCYAT